ncbi:MAG: DUF2946 domain-containing protein [Caulobacteraceae bacterium]|nr:DUF2946 domain-containing protein [Caulobacteraceae bacterium]
MNRSQADNWSVRRSLAFLAATFAITFGSLMPFAALAASTPGHPLVICSAEGPQTIAIDVDGVDQSGQPHSGKGMMGAKCAACLLALSVALPEPPLVTPTAAPTTRPASVFIAEAPRLTPPARAPPRPPSTAPPHA